MWLLSLSGQEVREGCVGEGEGDADGWGDVKERGVIVKGRGDGEGVGVGFASCPLSPSLPLAVYYRTYPRSHYDDSRANRRRQRKVIIQRNTSPGRLSNRELGSSSESLRTTESDQALQVLADLAVAAGQPPQQGH